MENIHGLLFFSGVTLTVLAVVSTSIQVSCAVKIFFKLVPYDSQKGRKIGQFSSHDHREFHVRCLLQSHLRKFFCLAVVVRVAAELWTTSG